MTVSVKSQQEIYEIVKNEILSVAPDFMDFSPGSILDIFTGAVSILGNELAELIISNFSKTFFNLAEGNDLDTLVVDHFGESFARPSAIKSSGTVAFSRPNAGAGNVLIPAGTVVKTLKDSQGKEVRFVTKTNVTITGTTINAIVEAVDAGVAGNVQGSKIVVLENALPDPTITVTNALAMAGGKETLTDAEYRDFAKVKLLSLAGATEAAVTGAALAVPGVAVAQIVTEEVPVIEYDIATDAPKVGALFFRIPRSKMYVADSSGNSSQALIDAVRAAIAPIKAAGVRFDVLGAFPVAINWTAEIELNPAGPNYAELSVDLLKIKDSMSEYINKVLSIGTGFNKAAADVYILSVWGPGGTGDLNTFETTVPSGNVGITASQKLISGVIEIA